MKANFSFQPKTLTLRRYQLLETRNYFLLIGTNKNESIYHILKLHRFEDTVKNVTLRDVIQEVPKTLNKAAMLKFVNKLSKEERVQNRVQRAYGILGFIKFLKGYYLIMVTERKREAKIG